MPTTAPMTKVAACRALGATIEQIGTTLEEATDRAHELAAEQALTLISPYDDWDITAGQASCGLEMLEDFEDMTTGGVPLGGGGLLARVALEPTLHRPRSGILGDQ